MERGLVGWLQRALGMSALALALGGCGELPVIPRSLGGLPLAHALQGEEALKEVKRLHGKGILAAGGFVAHYERDGAVAMLYVSSAYAGPIARWQMAKMVRGIEKAQAGAKGPFFHLKERAEGGLTVYSVLGLGQVHYFYRSGAAVVWLAADPAVVRTALADTLRLVR